MNKIVCKLLFWLSVRTPLCELRRQGIKLCSIAQAEVLLGSQAAVNSS